MTDDALLPFIRAYRDENPAASLDARAIRRRVLLGFQLRQRRRLFTVRFLLPIAATFFGSVALAASQGALPRWQEVREWLGAEPSAPAPKPAEAPRQVRGVRRANPPLPAQKNVEPPVIEPPVIELPAIEPPASQRPSAPEVRVSTGDAPVAPAASAIPTAAHRDDLLKADLTAYERAHRLHFHGGDPSAALAAWDAYLASHGAGTFVPEARFNRAICLLRLGRRAEAKVVLTSIAESGTAVYGRDRARALLDAMQ